MNIESSVARKIGWLIVGLLILFLAWCSSGATKSSQAQLPAPVFIQHDSSGPYIFNLDHLRELVQGTEGLGYSCAPRSAGIE